MSSTIDVGALKKGVRAALKHMAKNPGKPAPDVKADYHQILAAAGMISDIFLREFQQQTLRAVRKTFEGDDPSPGCLKAADGPFTKVDEGVQGCTWLTKDKKRIFKVGKVSLRESHGLTRKYEEARMEFAITKAAGDLRIGPKVHDAYFCCDQGKDQCYYVILMDFVPGKSLWKWHKTASPAKRTAMRKKLLNLVRSLNDAGIEHADLHAENVIVSGESEHPVIIDYGMASWTKLERAKDRLSIDRFFSDTTTLQDTMEHVAKLMIHSGDIKIK